MFRIMLACILLLPLAPTKFHMAHRWISEGLKQHWYHHQTAGVTSHGAIHLMEIFTRAKKKKKNPNKTFAGRLSDYYYTFHSCHWKFSLDNQITTKHNLLLIEKQSRCNHFNKKRLPKNKPPNHMFNEETKLMNIWQTFYKNK